MIESIEKIDTLLFLFLNSVFSSTALNYFFVAITDARFWIIPGVTAALFFLIKYKRKAFIIIGLSLITVAISDPVSSQVAKPFFNRHRPCHPDSMLIEKTHTLLGLKGSNSFPSSHATNMFAQAMLLSLFYPAFWVIFFSFATLIGFSRIYVGVHFPGDVLFGSLLGIMIGISVFLIYKYLSNILSKAKE